MIVTKTTASNPRNRRLAMGLTSWSEAADGATRRGRLARAMTSVEARKMPAA
ncbi:hypothetical protein D3C83_245700 [compost metagenome]